MASALLLRMHPVIGRKPSCSVSLMIRTGGEWRGVRHDRHFSAASSFQIGVPRGRRIASIGRLARVLHRYIPPQASQLPPFRHCAIVGDGCAGPPRLPSAAITPLPRLISLARCFDGPLAGAFSTNLRAHDHDGAAIDRLARFGAHDSRLHRTLRSQQMTYRARPRLLPARINAD